MALAGYFPFWNPDDRDDPEFKRIAVSRIVNGVYTLVDYPWNEISEEAKDFIRCTIQVDPQRRLPISQLLQHPWILNNNVEYNRQKKRKEEFNRTSKMTAAQLGRNDDYYE